MKGISHYEIPHKFDCYLKWKFKQDFTPIVMRDDDDEYYTAEKKLEIWNTRSK